jgi:hypothetical protein
VVGAAGEPTQAEPVDVYKNITKEDFLKEIQGELEVIDEDALGMVSDILVKTKDETGKDLFMFKNQDGSTVKLEDLDKDTLALIHTRVSQARVIVQAQRIQRQIEAVNRDLQTIQTIQQIHASQSQAPRNPQPAAPPPTAAPGQNVQPPPQPPPNPPQPYIPPPQPPRQER